MSWISTLIKSKFPVLEEPRPSQPLQPLTTVISWGCSSSYLLIHSASTVVVQTVCLGAWGGGGEEGICNQLLTCGKHPSFNPLCDKPYSFPPAPQGALSCNWDPRAFSLQTCFLLPVTMGSPRSTLNHFNPACGFSSI